MKSVLIVVELDEKKSLQKSTLELLARAKGLDLKSNVVLMNAIDEKSLDELKSSINGKIYKITNECFGRYSTKSYVAGIEIAFDAASVDSVWFSASSKGKDLCAYFGYSRDLLVFEDISELNSIDGSLVLNSEVYAGKFNKKSQIQDSEKTAISFVSGFPLCESFEWNCEAVSELDFPGNNNISFVGDLELTKKEDGVSLTDAELVLDVGDGVGAKGISAIKKMAALLKVKGVKVAIGASRVVTDAGRMPRNTQIGISGISVSPELIISIGVSGAPQHWAGMKNAALKVCVNTDEEAPIMKMVDVPILGDGHLFLKDIMQSLQDSLTDEQKEALKKNKDEKPKTHSIDKNISQEPLDDLVDMSLNIDMRGITFDSFELYKTHEISEHWNREKLTNLLQKAAKYAEKYLNQGKRNAEREGVRFIPGEENKERAILAPQGYKEAWDEYYKSGLGRISVPRSLGGLEVPHGVQDYISEIISSGSPAMGTYYGLTQGAQVIVENFGSDWMKENILPGLMNGRFQGTMCLTEAQAGSDLAAVKTDAERIEDSDEFLINGTKIFITSGDHDIVENHFHIVLAKIKGTGMRGTRAISLFLVPKFSVDEDGDRQDFNHVVTQSIEHKSGLMTSPTCVLKFENSRGWLLAENIEEEFREPSGMKKMFFFMNSMRHETGTAGRGQAVATCLDALVYSTERLQGVAIKEMGEKVDQSLIIKHGNQKKSLCDMFARTQGDRGLTQMLTEIRDRAHLKYNLDIEQYEERKNKLSLDSDQEKELDSCFKQLKKIKRQLSKSKNAKKKLRKDKGALLALAKDIELLTSQKEKIRNQVKNISSEYLLLQDLKEKAIKDREDEETYASIFTSLVKAQVTDDNVRTLVEGMQAYGGIGFMAETPVSQRLHDSQILCIWEGTNDIQSLNTVFRQIGDQIKDSKGRVVFKRFLHELNQFILTNEDNAELSDFIASLRDYAMQLSDFRDALCVSKLWDKLKFHYTNFGFKIKPSKREMIQAQIKWGERMQAAARSFNTYFSQTVQAWQLLRGALKAQEYLKELAIDPKTTVFDDETYDQKFLEGRILLAKHFISSPNCLDKGVFLWKDLFFKMPAVEMEYEHLADTPSKISMS